MVWAVTPIRYGALSPIPSAVLGWEPPDAQTFTLPSLGYLLHETSLGRYCLVDLGPSSPQISRSHGRAVVIEAEWQGVGSALRQAGFDPLAVEAVIVTHAHWDHSYGSEELPAAEIIVQRADLEFAADEHCEQARFFDREGGMQTPGIALRVIDGDVEVAAGLRCLRIGGHTPGSQVVLIETAQGLVACLGDLAHRYENILGLTAGGRPRPSGLLVDRAEWAMALERLAAMAVIPLLAHDERSRMVLRHAARLAAQGAGYRIHGDEWELFPNPASTAALEPFRAA